MKKSTQILCVFAFLSFAAGSIQAQASDNPLLVVSYQKVKLIDLATVNNMINEKFAPILNGLVDEEMINSWGLFNHAWGDEWNVNIWYVAKDMPAFDKFWDEYIKRIGEQQPEAWAKLRGYIQEHKDNMYIILNQYPLPPK